MQWALCLLIVSLARCSLQPTPVNGVLCYGPLQAPIAPIYPPPKFSMGVPEKDSKDNGSCSTLNHQTDGQRGVDERVSPQGTCCSCSGNTHQPLIGWIEHSVPSTGLYVPIYGSPLLTPYQNLEQMTSNDQTKDQNVPSCCTPISSTNSGNNTHPSILGLLNDSNKMSNKRNTRKTTTTDTPSKCQLCTLFHNNICQKSLCTSSCTPIACCPLPERSFFQKNCSTDLCDNNEKSTVVSNPNIERNDEQSSTIKNNRPDLGKKVPCLELDRSEDSSEEIESLSETTPQITRIQYTNISDNTCTSEVNTSKSNKCLPKTGIAMHSNIQNTNKNANKQGSNSFLQNKSNIQMSSRTQPKVLPQNERRSFTEQNKLKKGIVKKFEDAKNRGIHTVSCRSKMEANQPEEIYLRDKRQRAYRSAENINWDCKRIHNDANENEQRVIDQTLFQHQKSDCDKGSDFLYESTIKTKAQDREEYGKSVVDSSDLDFEQITSKVFSTNENVITEETMSREDIQNKPFTVENSSLLYVNSENGDDYDEQPLLTVSEVTSKFSKLLNTLLSPNVDDSHSKEDDSITYVPNQDSNPKQIIPTQSKRDISRRHKEKTLNSPKITTQSAGTGYNSSDKTAAKHSSEMYSYTKDYKSGYHKDCSFLNNSKSCSLKEKDKLTAIAKTKLTNGEINTKVPLNPKDSWKSPIVALLDKYQTNQTTVKQFEGEPIEYHAQDFVGKLVAKDDSEKARVSKIQ